MLRAFYISEVGKWNGPMACLEDQRLVLLCIKYGN